MDKMDGKLRNYDRVIFNNSCLELCLAQLKYPPVQRFFDDNYMVDIKEALASMQGIGQAPGPNMLRFTSIDSRWSVVLSSEFVSLETRTYTNVSELSTRFANVLHHINTHFSPRHQLRFGLRYINEFRHPSGDSYKAWMDFLNPELLGLVARGVLGGKVEQTIGEVLTHRDDGRLLVRHGFLKGSTIIPNPGRPATIEQMLRYNDVLYNVFRWSIGDGELYRYLKGDL